MTTIQSFRLITKAEGRELPYEASPLGGFFVFETRQLDETRWGQTSLYSTRGQTSSRLRLQDTEVNRGSDFIQDGGSKMKGQTPTTQDEGQELRGIKKMAPELKPTNQKV